MVLWTWLPMSKAIFVREATFRDLINSPFTNNCVFSILIVLMFLHVGMTQYLASPTGSSHTSKYFGSVDSSENDHSRKQTAGGNGEAQFIKCVLQDPIWLLMADTDEKIMMTYQLPIRFQNKIHTDIRVDGMTHLE